MARFLLAVWPFTGHIYPNIALANGLRARGHEVAIYTGAMAREAVERESFLYVPFDALARRLAQIVGEDSAGDGPWDYPELYQRVTDRYTASYEARGLARARQMNRMYHEWFLGSVPEQVTDLQAIMDGWQPDVLVSDPFMWGPFMVLGETQPVPVAVFSYFAACLLPGPDAPPFASGLPSPRTTRARLLSRSHGAVRALLFGRVRRDAGAMRARYGLSPLPGTVMEYAGRLPLYLVASVPEFDYGRRDLPDAVHYVGPMLWDKPSSEQAPQWLDELPVEQPLVYVTEGTAHTRAPIVLQAAAKGLADRPMQVVLTTGRNRDAATLGLDTTAPNVRVKQWVSHSDILPRADAMVTHGGSATVLAGLAAGLPQVVIPMQWDHAENAQRLVEAGAGIRINAADCTPERVRAAVQRLFDDPSFGRNARRLAGAFERYNGPSRASILLEGLSARRPQAERFDPNAATMEVVGAKVSDHD